MYSRRSTLFLAVMSFLLAFWLLTFCVAKSVNAEGSCESITSVNLIETYGDLSRFGLNDNTDLSIGYSDDLLAFTANYRDSIWNGWQDETQKDVYGYPVLRFMFYIGYDTQYDYIVSAYQNQNNPDELIAFTWSFARFNNPDSEAAQHPDCGAYYLEWESLRDLIFID